MKVQRRSLEDRMVEDGALLRKFIASAFSFVFSFVYALFLSNLPLLEFKDRANYLEYARYSELILASNALGGWKEILANEPLWLLTNVGLALLFDNSDLIIRIIIFVPAFVISFLILRKNPAHVGWLVFFLLTPQIIKNHIIHLRQGFGIAVFLLGYYSSRAWIRYPLMAASGFIHSSFFVVNLIGISAWISGKTRLSSELRLSLLLFAFMFIGVSLNVLAAGLGARQGIQYAETGVEVSGLGFLIWGSVLMLLASSGTAFLIFNIFPLSILVYYLSGYFVSPVGARIFESGLLLLLITGLSLTGWRKQVFLGLMVGYSIMSYITRIGKPMLGWGGF